MKNREKESEFEKYLLCLDEREREIISVFFEELRQRVCCCDNTGKIIIEAYKDAVLYCHKNEMSPCETVKRLDIGHLGGFYARRSGLWYPLDISSSFKTVDYLKKKEGKTTVIYNMGEKIEPSFLQIAWVSAVKKYPFFSCRLKKGFFNYYLEGSKHIRKVLPCTGNDHINEGEFYQLYYKNRQIILTFLDGIADNYGVLCFLRAICEYYTYLISSEIEEKLKSRVESCSEYRENICEFENMQIVPSECDGKIKESIILEGNEDFFGWITKSCTMSRRELEEICFDKGVSLREYFFEMVCKGVKYSTDRLRGEVAIEVSRDVRSQINSQSVRNCSVFDVIRFKKEDDEGIKRAVLDLNDLWERSPQSTLSRIKATWDKTKYTPLYIKPFLKSYRQISKLYKATASFGYLEIDESWYGEELYFLLKPALGTVGCFVTVLDSRVVLTVTNGGIDPSVVENIKRFLLCDGVVWFEERAIVKSRI